MLSAPIKHYRRADRLLRSFEKLTTVTTTIDIDDGSTPAGQVSCFKKLHYHSLVQNGSTTDGLAASKPMLRQMIRVSSELPIADTPEEHMTGVDPTKMAEGPVDPEVAAAMDSESAALATTTSQRPISPVPPTSCDVKTVRFYYFLTSRAGGNR